MRDLDCGALAAGAALAAGFVADFAATGFAAARCAAERRGRGGRDLVSNELVANDLRAAREGRERRAAAVLRGGREVLAGLAVLEGLAGLTDLGGLAEAEDLAGFAAFKFLEGLAGLLLGADFLERDGRAAAVGFFVFFIGFVCFFIGFVCFAVFAGFVFVGFVFVVFVFAGANPRTTARTAAATRERFLSPPALLPVLVLRARAGCFALLVLLLMRRSCFRSVAPPVLSKCRAAPILPERL